jgi:hypothetical protein
MRFVGNDFPPARAGNVGAVSDDASPSRRGFERVRHPSTPFVVRTSYARCCAVDARASRPRALMIPCDSASFQLSTDLEPLSFVLDLRPNVDNDLVI